MSGALKYEPALDGLRGIAIASVLGFHAFPTVLPGGWAGVDVFFVLSGYLITRLLRNEADQIGRIDLLRFYTRRALRLMPALWCLLIFMGVLILLANHRDGMTKSWVMTATYLMNWNRALGWWPEDYLGHTWSLAAEEQFYLLWPLAFLFVRNRRPLLWVTAAIVAVIAWRSYLTLHGAPFVRVYNGFDTSSDPILIGCALALVTIPPAVRGFLEKTWPLWLAALVGLLAPLSFRATFTQTIGISVIAILSAIIIVISGSGPVHNLLARRPLVFTGRISYALYLWHWPLLEITRVRAPEMSPAIPLAATLIVATVSTFTVERYFRSMKDRLDGPLGWLSTVANKYLSGDLAAWHQHPFKDGEMRRKLPNGDWQFRDMTRAEFDEAQEARQ